MARLQTSLKRFSEAEPMHKRSLLILRKALGEDHPDTIECQEQYDILRSKLTGGQSPTSDNESDLSDVPSENRRSFTLACRREARLIGHC